jgi:hypothetical protein
MRYRIPRSLKYVLFAMAVVGSLAANTVYRSSAYWDGYRTFESPPGLLQGLLPVLAVVACGLVAIMSAVALFPFAATEGRRRFLDFAPFLIVIVLLVSLWTTTQHRQYYFVKGMRDWVGERPEIVREIDKWFHNLEKDKSLSKTGGYLIDNRDSHPGEKHIKAEWPPCVKRLDPSCATLINVHGVWRGEVTCGGGFLHWGLVICDSQEAVASELYGYTMRVGPNSYVFADGPENRLFVD